LFIKDQNRIYLVCPDKCEYLTQGSYFEDRSKRLIQYDSVLNDIKHPFCPLCGKALVKVVKEEPYYRCSLCNYRVASTDNFCKHCGARRNQEC